MKEKCPPRGFAWSSSIRDVKQYVARNFFGSTRTIETLTVECGACGKRVTASFHTGKMRPHKPAVTLNPEP
jgi:hypothetical protein